MLRLFWGVLSLCISASAFCVAPTPLGLWKTVGDKQGETESLVRITETDGELQGRVQTIFSPPAPTPNPICDQCAGELKNQPVVGMKILTGLRRKGDEFTGGEILDPDEGKTYKCTVRLIEGGSKLEVRGYIGISIFGRTQTWLRVE